MKLYNTLTRRVEDLNYSNNVVRVYLCGVTVYDNAHIGHARTIIVFDVLRRYLCYKGLKVKFIQNFTDIDDKIVNRARTEGLKADQIATRYIQDYFKDFDRLNILEADYYPRATENIKEIINLIAELIKKDFAYISLNGVYFRVKSFLGYGKLSRKPIEELEAGARVQVDPSKNDPLDFALWKFYSDEPIWDSPWGKGRPGWHIECSAMALKYLGSCFEIHGGGSDLIFPHHENEIAQSESFTGKQFAKLWLHSGMVTINSEKMSKSLGNIVSIGDVLEKWGMNTFRIYCISIQYSKPLDYTDMLLRESMQKWRQIETCAYELRFPTGKQGDVKAIQNLCDETKQMFESAMDDNMNTSLALTTFMKFVSELNRYAAESKLTEDISTISIALFTTLMNILGLKVLEAETSEKSQIEDLINKRNRLRAQRKFDDSDAIRKRLRDLYSVELMDHKDRTVWKKVEKRSVPM